MSDKPGPAELKEIRRDPEKILEICRACKGQCCTYVAVEIDEPEEFEDFENIRWYCAHKGTWVFKDDEGWYVAFDSPCEYLDEDFTCKIYEKRPSVCQNHDFGECDYFLDGEFELELRSLEDVDDYLRERFPRQFIKRPQRKRK